MVSSNPRPAMLESAHIYTTGGPNAQIASAANQRNLCHFLCRSVHSDDSEVPIQPLCPIYVQQRSGSQRSEPHRRIPSRRSRVGFRCPRATHRPPHVHVAQNAANFSRQVCRFRSDCKSAEGRRNKDPAALNGMLAAIDQGALNSVWVMVVEDGVNIAGMGGLMGTAMSSRGYSGAVIDGGVRDLGQLRKIGFPVFALGVVPSTSVHHYRFAGSNVPLVCDGVDVQPGDIISADNDGVVVVPRARAEEVLALAQTLDFQEHSMYGYIEKYKSIQEAVKKFGRL